MMSETDILTKAIEKAIAGGWQTELGSTVVAIVEHAYWNEYAVYFNAGKTSITSLIFNHDFARSLWGEEDSELDLELVDPEQGGWLDKYEQPSFLNWKKHLMQMVISENPIKYLGDNIPTEKGEK